MKSALKGHAMKIHESDAFWEGGEDAWWKGLRDAIKAAAERIKSTESDEERIKAQAALERLNRQLADAKKNGRSWLF